MASGCMPAGTVPDSWAVLSAMPAGDREALLGRVLELPPADVDSLLEEHSEYLGLHMRNTKFMAAEVRPPPFRNRKAVCAWLEGEHNGSCDDPPWLWEQGFGNLDLLAEGTWVSLGGGGRLWSLSLMSADAPSHMLLFECGAFCDFAFTLHAALLLAQSCIQS